MKHNVSFAALVAAALFLASTKAARAADLDLSGATVVAPDGLTGPERQAVKMLVEEVLRRSWVRWETASAPPRGAPAIVVGPAAIVGKIVAIPAGKVGREGFRIGVVDGNVYVAGDDARGTLFGVGRLLRELRIERERVSLPSTFAVASAPKTALRGHQLGYRPKTNSYDGWTVAMWEQYVRDLIVFGCNAIELIPPRSDDDADSPHYPDPPLRMMAAMSRIADSYGIDVWIWYPAMDADYSNPATVEAALKEWRAVFRALPRVDAVFVPGGDPGHTPPKVLFPFLEKQTANLKAVHPKAAMWMSPQSFTGPAMDDFVQLVKREPKWLAGIVHGPQVRVSIPKLRAAIPAKYPIRDYPDITHSRTCQYPVPDWDLAFALTIGREGCNPRPNQMAAIHRHARPHTDGFITYSEGCHDDVNKMLWSALGWDDGAHVREILRQYGRHFVGPKLGDRFAGGLLALEKNWIGPALDNAGIDETLKLFQSMEKDAGPGEKRNWRFQQSLYRAYYDAYVRTRLRHELAATDGARDVLRNAKSASAIASLDAATAILDRAARERPGAELKARTGELAEALFQSIHAQLTVRKHGAISVHRGASFDTIDTPLSDAQWLRSEIEAAQKIDDAEARLARIRRTVKRADPGPGGFYDNLGDPRNAPHLIRGPGWEKDPGYYDSPLPAYGRGSPPLDAPRAWWDYAQTHYDTPLRLRYDGLESAARYRVRVVYSAAELRKVRLTANSGTEIHPGLLKHYEELEFPIPATETSDGSLTLNWWQDAGTGGTGRGPQVCEVWLIRETPAPKK